MVLAAQPSVVKSEANVSIWVKLMLTSEGGSGQNHGGKTSNNKKEKIFTIKLLEDTQAKKILNNSLILFNNIEILWTDSGCVGTRL